MVFNPDKNPGIQEKDVPRFNVQENDSVTNNQNTSQELVDDPEAAAMGGFDRGSGNIDNVDVNEEVGADSEAAQRETKSAEVENSENDSVDVVENNYSFDDLKSNLTDAREVLAVKKRRSETSLDKVRSLLGMNVNVDNVNDEIRQLQENYDSALAALRDNMHSQKEGLNTVEQKKINEELMYMSWSEGVEMNNAETKVRLETKFGSVGDKIQKVGLWYKGLPKSVKYGLAAGMFGTGLLTGVAGVAGGALVVGAGAKRLFGAAAMGVGVGMALETRSSNKQKESEDVEKLDFSELSLEQQNEAIKNMNLDTQGAYEKIKTTRRKIKFASIGAAAGLLMGGSMLSHAFAGDAEVGDNGDSDVSKSEYLSEMNAEELASEVQYGENVLLVHSHDFTNEMKETDVFERFQNKYGPEGYQKFLESDVKLIKNGEEIVDLEGKREWWNKSVQRASVAYVEHARNEMSANVTDGFAQQMNIENVKQATLENNIPTSINGNPVPEHLFSDEQRAAIASARGKSEWVPNENGDVKSGKIYQSKDIGDNEWEDDYIKSEMEADEARWAETEKDIKIAQGIAKGMGIDNLDKLEFATDFSTMNGQTVPEHLLTEEQRSLIETNRAMDEGYKMPQSGGVADNPTSYPDEVATNDEYLEQLSRDGEAIKTGSVEVFQQGQKNLLELLQNTDGVSADTTMGQLNMTDNRVLRDMMTGITVRAAQEFGSQGFPNEGEGIGTYLQRIGELGGSDGVVNADVLREVADKSLDDYQIDTNTPDTPETAENPFANMSESEAMRELVSDPEFKTAVARQMQEMSGVSNIQNAINNVAKTEMNFYLADSDIGLEKEEMEALRNRAVKAFGDSGNPRPGVRTGEYFTRIFAKAVHKGKVKDIFPSSDFVV